MAEGAARKLEVCGSNPARGNNSIVHTTNYVVLYFLDCFHHVREDLTVTDRERLCDWSGSALTRVVIVFGR